uniref:SPX domain-containing protein n=1 Tax=Pyrodinium bahamense TaxID=73915 RepID=A0A7S0FCH2_9DINO
MEDQSGAPYLSHKPMKEAINRTVRELRLYQAKCQGSEAVWRGGAALGFMAPGGGGGDLVPAASREELRELEDRIYVLDRDLFSLVDADLARILSHVRLGEAHLATRIVAMQGAAKQAAVLIEESQLQRLECILPQAPEDRSVLSRQLLELKVRSDPLGVAKQLQEISTQHNNLVDAANQHSQYIEINVAGFRKLLKRHEKQIPQKFRSRHMPCLDFHRLVTHTSRQLLELTRQLGSVVADSWQLLSLAIDARGRTHTEAAAQASKLCRQRPELHEVKGLGPECEMVLHIQRQLKEPMNGQMIQLAANFNGPSPGFLYPKPAVPARGANAQHQHQHQHQQQTAPICKGPVVPIEGYGKADRSWILAANTAAEGDGILGMDMWRN